MERNIDLFNKIRDDLRKSSNNLALKKATRMWIEGDFRIHALNYWYYRWFTNEFELFLMSTYYQNKEKSE